MVQFVSGNWAALNGTGRLLDFGWVRRDNEWSDRLFQSEHSRVRFVIPKHRRRFDRHDKKHPSAGFASEGIFKSEAWPVFTNHSNGELNLAGAAGRPNIACMTLNLWTPSKHAEWWHTFISLVYISHSTGPHKVYCTYRCWCWSPRVSDSFNMLSKWNDRCLMVQHFKLEYG